MFLGLVTKIFNTAIIKIKVKPEKDLITCWLGFKLIRLNYQQISVTNIKLANILLGYTNGLCISDALITDTIYLKRLMYGFDV